MCNLDNVQLYLELERLRFNFHFEFEINMSPDADLEGIKVPPLLIQPYIENSIWHGLMHKEEKGHLKIDLYQEDELLFCRITDDGIGRKKSSEIQNKNITHQSMGMRITADRIARVQNIKTYENYVTIRDLVLPDGNPSGTEVILKIPIVYD
jgi:LytS/YehU family sensor histidine kinase